MFNTQWFVVFYTYKVYIVKQYYHYIFGLQSIFFSFHSIAYIEFKTEAEAEKMLEEAQGAELQGRSIIVDYVGDKSQKGARPSGKL